MFLLLHLSQIHNVVCCAAGCWWWVLLEGADVADAAAPAGLIKHVPMPLLLDLMCPMFCAVLQAAAGGC
jgi:hypothetical protein